jgi:hypothetical protein
VLGALLLVLPCLSAAVAPLAPSIEDVEVSFKGNFGRYGCDTQRLPWVQDLPPVVGRMISSQQRWQDRVDLHRGSEPQPYGLHP